jgi:cytochrome d ubiquinol oxidase subunit II
MFEALRIDAATLIAVVMALALVLYAVSGGADYGGGVWDLFARGPRKTQQRALIERAIGPIWEANHVWLILVVVLLFACFPRGYAVLSTALHIPLTLALLGIVARGTAFTFRHYDVRGAANERAWGLVFSVASLVTPIVLGVIVGSVASGGIRVDARGAVTSGFFSPWATTVFPWLVGLLTLSLFALLAAVYLCVEAGDDRALATDFRRRALLAMGASTFFAAAALAASERGAPRIWDSLALPLMHATTIPSGHVEPYSLQLALIVHVATGACALLTIATLLTQRDRVARLAAPAFVGLVVVGWMAAQYPLVITPDVSIRSAAAPQSVLHAVLYALAGGSLLLAPSLVYLFRLFKSRPSVAH